MKLAIIGYSGAGKSLSACIISEYLKCQYADTSSELINGLAEFLEINPQTIIDHKSEFRKALYYYGMKMQKHNAVWPQNVLIEKGVDIITGLRNPFEVIAARKANFYDAIIWINRPKVIKGFTDKLSDTDADYIINNNSSVENLQLKLIKLIKSIASTISEANQTVV